MPAQDLTLLLPSPSWDVRSERPDGLTARLSPFILSFSITESERIFPSTCSVPLGFLRWYHIAKSCRKGTRRYKAAKIASPALA